MNYDSVKSTIVPEMLTQPQAAKLCGFSGRTLWTWSRNGIAPAPIKIGPGKRPRIFYMRSEIMAWIAARCPRVDGGAN